MIVASLAIALAAIGWLAIARILSLAVPVLLSRLATLAPWPRGWAVLGLAAYPFWLVSLSALLVFTPEVTHGLGMAHCHGGACGSHAPSGSPSLVPYLAVLLLGLMPLGLLLVLLSLAANGAARRRRVLQRLSRSAEGLGRSTPQRILPAEDSYAFCMGWWRPEVVLSSGALARLGEAELAAVLAHEHSHARNRDNLRVAVLGLLALPFDRVGRGALLNGFRGAAEQEADRVAALAVDDETLLRARAQLTDAPAGAGIFRAPESHARVSAIAATERQRLLSPALVLPASIMLTTPVLMLAPLLHHLAELCLH